MSPVGKALWYIESYFAEKISLDDIASVAGVSRYHLSRSFGVATGQSIQHYVRGRLLADGAPDILTVALDSVYGSHEAFSRAFREQFGVTPETVRGRGNLDDIELVEAIKMEEALIALKTPRLERRKAILIAGLSERYNNATSSGIPAQWQRFGPYIGNIPGQVDGRAYGVRCNPDDDCSLDYICGVEVSRLSSIPEGLTGLRIPEQNYAVFTHEGHVSGIRSTWHTIFSQWLPASGYEVVDAPDFELYGEDFDPRTGMGSTEIWIPVRPA